MSVIIKPFPPSERGAIAKDDRVELIDGAIIDMPPIHPHINRPSIGSIS